MFAVTMMQIRVFSKKVGRGEWTRKKEDNAVTQLGLSSTKPNSTLLSVYVNHLPLLNKFFDYVIEEYQKFSRELEERGLDMVEIRGTEAFYGKEYGKEYCQDPMKMSKLLYSLGGDSFILARAQSLSIREKQVIEACVDGKTAFEIGDDLELSPRTIEHYLNNAKSKLGLFTKGELMRCGRTLKEAGLLDLT
jgi:DNA-binding CsgD family transcriptional regulator